MKQPVVHGHPIHAALSDGPAALAPVAFIAQLWSLVRRSQSSRESARTITRFSFAAAAVAAVAGWWDWTKMPREHEAWRPATIHGAINSAVTSALFVASVSRKRRTKMLALASGLVGVGGWIGGNLVFHHGWRVRPVEEFEIIAPQIDPLLVERARAEVDDYERRETYLP